jgi:hypothetical protein
MDNQKIISILNDLLHIANDRLEGFEKVEGKIWEMNHDLQDFYEHMTSQSKIMKNQLINLISEKVVNPMIQHLLPEDFTVHGSISKMPFCWAVLKALPWKTFYLERTQQYRLIRKHWTVATWTIKAQK